MTSIEDVRLADRAFTELTGLHPEPFDWLRDGQVHHLVAADVLASITRLRRGLPIAELSIRSHFLLLTVATERPIDPWDVRDFGDLLGDPEATWWTDQPASKWAAPFRTRPPILPETPDEPADSLCAVGSCTCHHGPQEHWPLDDTSVEIPLNDWWRLSPDRILQRAWTDGFFRIQAAELISTGPMRYIGHRLALMHHRARITRSELGSIALVALPPRNLKTGLGIGLAGLVVDQSGGGGPEQVHGRYGVVSMSRSDTLARRRARDLRRLLSAPWLDGDVPRESSAVNSFECSGGGVVVSAGVKGSVLGSDAQAFVLDDPFANADRAASQVESRFVYEDVYESQLRSRLEPGAGGIGLVVSTRLAPSDVVGRCLEADDADIRFVDLTVPAISEAVDDPTNEDPLCRPNGESGNRRVSGDAYRELRRSMAARRWAGEMMQDPVAAASTGVLPRGLWVNVSGIDPAVDLRHVTAAFDLGATTDGDSSACVWIAWTNSKPSDVDEDGEDAYIPYLVLNVDQVWLPPSGVNAWMVNHCTALVEQYGTIDGVTYDVCIERQSAAAGLFLSDSMDALLAPIVGPIEWMPAQGSKLFRVQASLSAHQNAGRIGIADTVDAAKRAEFVAEADAFDGAAGGSDNVVDATAYGMLNLTTRTPKKFVRRRRKAS